MVVLCSFQSLHFSKKVEYFVVPSDKNLLSVQDRMKEYFNCVYFQTHNKIKIKTWNKLYRNNEPKQNN